jgi:AbrB family looped-hinge helix DNA binding protein
MAKVTSKLQITLPKALAKEFGIHPGDDILWQSAGDTIRIVPAKVEKRIDIKTRLTRFDQATARQLARQREGNRHLPTSSLKDRGWTREELYDRGRPH